MTDPVFHAGDRVHLSEDIARKDKRRSLARIRNNLGTVTHVDVRAIVVMWDYPYSIRTYEPNELVHQNIIARLGRLSDGE